MAALQGGATIRLEPMSTPGEFAHSVPGSRLPWVWDYDLDEQGFRALLEGRETRGRLDRDWAAVRLLEYAPYREIRRLMSFRDLLAGWPRWRGRIRSASRRRGFDFLAEWLPRHHPELL
jgi:hypothetical protein